MVNPGSFHGLRKDFLLGEKATYGKAVAGGYEKDIVVEIQRRFFKRFPVELPLNEEPSAEHLASVNDADPDPEPEQPDENSMTQEEYASAKSKVEDRAKLIMFRKGQIKRWLEYQYMKGNTQATKGGAKTDDQYRLLLCQLTGASNKAPRLRSAVNLWRKSHTDAIEREVSLRAERDNISKKLLAPVREKVAKEQFGKLSLEEQADWSRQAKEEHQTEIKKWKEEALSSPELATCLEDRQKCIQNLTSFVQPILDGICAVTGWKATLIAGGPEPAHGGRLNVVSIHSGATSGDIKMNFGRAEQVRYRKYIVPIFGDFLKKCYTVRECRECALPEDDDPEHLEVKELEGVDHVYIPTYSDSDQGFVQRSISPPCPSTSAQGTLPSDQNLPSPEVSPNVYRRSSILSPPSRVPTPLPPSAVSPLNSPGLSAILNDILPLLDNLEPDLLGDPMYSTTSATVQQAYLEQGLEVHGEGTMSAVPISASDLNVAMRLTSTAVQQIQPEQGPPVRTDNDAAQGEGVYCGDAVPADKEEVDDTPERTSKRQHISIQDSIPPADGEEVDDTPERNSKRRRTSVHDSKAPTTVERPTLRRQSTRGKGFHKQAPGSSSVPPSSAAPPWFLCIHKLFSENGLGNEWTKLILAWATFEKLEHYKGDGRLTASGRPDVVKQWISRARSTTWRPEISNLKDYEDKYNKWWKALQPPWRVVDDRINFSLTQGDWSYLRLSGVNGILSVIAALFFWGLATKQDGNGRGGHKAWLSAVEDCHLVLSFLTL